MLQLIVQFCVKPLVVKPHCYTLNSRFLIFLKCVQKSIGIKNLNSKQRNITSIIYTLKNVINLLREK